MNLQLQGDKEDLQLQGDDYFVTNPYNLPNSQWWQCTIKPKLPHLKDKYVLTFVSKIRAEVFKKGNVNSIRFCRCVLVEGEKLTTMYMANQKDIDLYLQKVNESKTSKVNNKDVAKELFGNELSEKELFGDMGISDDLNINEMMDAWEEYYEDKSSDATTKAKNLLVSISSHYLTKDILSEDSYVRMKLSIQAESLSMMFMQLGIVKQVLGKLFKEIMSDIGNKATYDFFSQQQKLILEINTFMNTTIQGIIDDMKQAKIRHEERKEELEKENTIEVEGETVGETIVVKDKIQFLKDLNKAVTDNKEDDEEITEEYVDRLRKEKKEKLSIKSED